MKFDDYIRYDALGLADLVRRGEVHPTELLAAALSRADDTASLNAIVMRLDESARVRAQAPFDTSAPFAGVPFLVKDLFQDMAGLPSSCGCRALKSVLAPEDSDVVRRWREAGLVIFGKTNTLSSALKTSPNPKPGAPPATPGTPNAPLAVLRAVRPQR